MRKGHSRRTCRRTVEAAASLDSQSGDQHVFWSCWCVSIGPGALCWPAHRPELMLTYPAASRCWSFLPRVSFPSHSHSSPTPQYLKHRHNCHADLMRHFQNAAGLEKILAGQTAKGEPSTTVRRGPRGAPSPLCSLRGMKYAAPVRASCFCATLQSAVLIFASEEEAAAAFQMKPVLNNFHTRVRGLFAPPHASVLLPLGACSTVLTCASSLTPLPRATLSRRFSTRSASQRMFQSARSQPTAGRRRSSRQTSGQSASGDGRCCRRAMSLPRRGSHA